MHSPTALWLLPLIYFAAFGLAQREWWIDQSCETKLGAGTVKAMLEEAVDTAKAVRTRLDNGDVHIREAFYQIAGFDYGDPGKTLEMVDFQRTIGDTSANPARGVTAFRASSQSGEIARTSSYLRVYCDNGAHWKARVTDPKLEAYIATLPANKPVYMDQANLIVTTEEPCKPGLSMQVVNGGRIPVDPLGSQSEQRHILDICDHWITPPQRPDGSSPPPRYDLVPKFAVQPSIPADGDTSGPRGIDHLDPVGSMTVLHELTHAQRPATGDAAYLWDGIRRLSPATAVETADTFQLLGESEQFLRQKYILDPRDPGSGRLVYDANLPGGSVVGR